MSPGERRSANLPTPEELLDGRHTPRPPRSATSRAADMPAAEVPVDDAPVRRKKRRGCVWGLLMILIVAVGVTAAVLDMRKRSRPDPTVRAGAMFADVERFTLRNEALGQIMVITGFVDNQSAATRPLRITAALHDKNGAPLAHSQYWAGLGLTDKQLQNLDKADLESALDAAKTIKVPAGDSVPFTIIFYQIPPDVAGCGLDVDGL